VIISWNDETNAPLVFVGEISAIYKGTVNEDTPMAIPKMILLTARNPGLLAAPVNNAPAANINAATRMTFFLPKMSVNLPEPIAPITAPISAAVVIHSCCPELKFQLCLRNGSAPEITPVSNPNNNPPVDAIAAIKIIKALFCLLDLCLIRFNG